jgi:N-acetylglucosaminyldiphosphoundecaprenol N-acetyl-beta-D-mannosaminyltransferase
MMHSYVNILGVRVHRISADELLVQIERAVRHGEKRIFAYLTVHGINLARKFAWFREFLNKADVVYPDGEGVRFGARILGERLPARIPLTRWIWQLADFCDKKELSVYLLGSTEEAVTTAAARLKERFSNLKLLGCHHGYFEKQGTESDSVIESINALSPHVLVVGFGMPAQEEWIMSNKDRLRVNAILTAGSCFDFVASVKRASPVWMQGVGLEWFFRLLQEPRRLFARYMIGNPVFVVRVLLQRIENGKMHSQSDTDLTPR